MIERIGAEDEATALGRHALPPDCATVAQPVGRLLRERGHDGFVHVELARPLRERLRNEQELRSNLAACLVTGMKGE